MNAVTPIYSSPWSFRVHQNISCENHLRHPLWVEMNTDISVGKDQIVLLLFLLFLLNHREAVVH